MRLCATRRDLSRLSLSARHEVPLAPNRKPLDDEVDWDRRSRRGCERWRRTEGTPDIDCHSGDGLLTIE
jgi:hypothetical protein